MCIDPRLIGKFLNSEEVLRPTYSCLCVFQSSPFEHVAQINMPASQLASSSFFFFMVFLFPCVPAHIVKSTTESSFDIGRSFEGRNVSSQWRSQRGFRNYKARYNRATEVQERCSSLLTDLSTNTSSPLMPSELSFENGDWQQDPAGVARLMPFVPLHADQSAASEENTPHLASLWITDVHLQDEYHGTRANVSAVLQLSISNGDIFFPMNSTPRDFHISPGFSRIRILMEGVYAKRRNGERGLCMVGCAIRPSPGKNPSNRWDWLAHVAMANSFSPPLFEDCNLVVQINYPGHFSLTSREIRGRLTSLQVPSAARYFNAVNFSSQLWGASDYQFSSGELVAAACAGNQPPEGICHPSPDVYQGGDICQYLTQRFSFQQLRVVPNWDCSLSEEFCNRIGPFANVSQLLHVDGGLTHLQMALQNVHCIDTTDNSEDVQSANVSAVFRLVTPSQNPHLAMARTSMDGLTIAAEGKWSSTSGQLCMVGCRNEHNLKEQNKEAACDCRICMYISRTFSLKQRSFFQGSISSIHNKNSFYPLSFLSPSQTYFWENLCNVSYNYSMIDAIQRDESSGLAEKVKVAVFKYPSAKSMDDLRVLIGDLSWYSSNGIDLRSKKKFQSAQLQVIAIEDYVSNDNWGFSTRIQAVHPVPWKVGGSTGYLKVAAQFDLQGNSTETFFVEGQYFPAMGRMHLVGCKEVHATLKVMRGSANLLEDGLDCKVEMTVEYPPTNIPRSMFPSVKLIVKSTRSDGDPFFFSEMKLHIEHQSPYRIQREDGLDRKRMGVALSLIIQSLMVGCIMAQLVHIRKQTDSMPYISLLMLLVQAGGYTVTLVTGVESLFEEKWYIAENRVDFVLRMGRWDKALGYMVKLLGLAAFLLTLQIAQIVYKSRIQLRTRRLLEPWRLPSENKKILAIFSAIHALGFVTLLLTTKFSPRSATSNNAWMGHPDQQHEWWVQEYVGIMQDLFLLPQIVSNRAWEAEGMKPLRKLFYVGITLLRLVPHVYEIMHLLFFSPYYAGFDVDKWATSMTVVVAAVLLAIVVHIQQSGVKWGKNKRTGLKAYDRLDSSSESITDAQMVDREHILKTELSEIGLSSSKNTGVLSSRTTSSRSALQN